MEAGTKKVRGKEAENKGGMKEIKHEGKVGGKYNTELGRKDIGIGEA